MTPEHKALVDAEASFEKIRTILVNCLNEPERSAFWEAVSARDKIRESLSAQSAQPQAGEAVAWLIERENGPEYFGHIPSYIPKHERTPEYGVHPLYTHPPHPADERVVEALKIGRSYVLDAMRNDGGIENCEIGYRTDYEKIHSALAALAQEGR